MGAWVRIMAIISLGIFGCGERVGNLFIPASSEPVLEEIYIAKHTWHTGIILKRSTFNNLSVLKEVYPGAEYLEIGWGDLDFFTSEKATPGMALKAMLWPTGSVLLVMPYYQHPSKYFDENKLIELTLPAEGYHKLLNYFNRSFALDQAGKIIPIESDSDVGGRFYLSVEKYYLFKTCNVWTARAIKEGGFSIVPFYALSSGNLMKQLRKKRKDY